VNLAGVACVKNEEDIVEAFVRHNAALLDWLLILDHGSTDRTPEILNALKEEGLPLTVITDHSLGKFQGEKMTYLMKRAASEFDADWIFLLDGDEFIFCQGKNLELPEVVDDTPVLKIPWKTYGPHPDDDQKVLNPVRRLAYRFAKEPGSDSSLEDRIHLLKAVVPRNRALTPGAVISQGNHVLSVAGKEISFLLHEELALAHYSIRSSGQYASKVSIAMLQHRYKISPAANMEAFYAIDYRQIKEDFTSLSKCLHEKVPTHLKWTNPESARVREPLNYRGGSLKYTRPTEDTNRFISNLLSYAEDQASTLSRYADVEYPELQRADEWVAATAEYTDVAGHERTDLQSFPAEDGGSAKIHFRLVDVQPGKILRIRISGPVMAMDVHDISYIGPIEMEETSLQGDSLKKRLFLKGFIVPIFHNEYVSFVKTEKDALVYIPLPASLPEAVSINLKVSLSWWVGLQPVGSRLVQNSNLNELIKRSEMCGIYQKAEKKRNTQEKSFFYRLKKLFRLS